MSDTISKVHVIFKTHLDVGFTNYAHKVIDQYFEHFIPKAIKLAAETQANSPNYPFRWTVGSWLVYEYLEKASSEQRAEMESAIDAGYINWHALPFTTHTELMTVDLFRAGLHLSQELDKRFGRTTIACKMTDVPGHTRAMIPLLAAAGVRFLHIGVNPVATVPDVPPLFEWRDTATDTSVIVMYQHVYGESMQIADTNEVISLEFTGDNLGPPSQESIKQTYVLLKQRYPNAVCVGSTLDNVARVLLESDLNLPVVTEEIGDTWIQGVGSDPTKISQYRQLLRLREKWVYDDGIPSSKVFAFDRQMMMIPEHTWGMDLKTHLADYDHYLTADLAHMRQTPKFANFEKSWQEQRDYIDASVVALPDDLQRSAHESLAQITPIRPNLSSYQVMDKPTLQTKHWNIEIDPQTGAIIHLENRVSGRQFADEKHMLGLMHYESFSTSDFDRYWNQYIRDSDKDNNYIWALPDNIKPGMNVAEHKSWHPTVSHLYHQANTDCDIILVEATFAPESKSIGAPDHVFINYCLGKDDAIDIRLQWFDKPACRLAEAFWLTFNPIVQQSRNWNISKLGQWISPLDVISKGARTLHSFDTGVKCHDDNGEIILNSLDAALVAPGKPSLIDFHNQLPDLKDGMHFNLYNNVWGTNFAMWFDDDALFRFHLVLR